MKKIIWGVLAVSTLMFTGCTVENSESSQAVQTPQITAQQEQANTPQIQESAPQAAPQVQTQPQAEAPQTPADKNLNTVLWESGGIKITYKGIEEDFMGVKMKVLVENNSSNNYNISLESIDVNDFSMNSMGAFYAEVNAGKKANEEITILSSQLDENGISGLSDVKTVNLQFKAVDFNNFMEQLDSPVITLSF